MHTCSIKGFIPYEQRESGKMLHKTDQSEISAEQKLLWCFLENDARNDEHSFSLSP